MKFLYIFFLYSFLVAGSSIYCQIGARFPSERKIVMDSITGIKLTFLTSLPKGDSKIYPTHSQWTADGQWIIFRSDRVPGEAMAVHEETGDIVQVTEGGYSGMLNIAQKSMKLYYMRGFGEASRIGRDRLRPMQVIELDLSAIFADSEAGTMKAVNEYERVCGTIPPKIGARGDMALDADEQWIYFRIGQTEASKHLAPDTEIQENFGPRNMGAGPSGIAKMNILSGEIKHVTSLPFQVGHIQANPWKPGEIIFCWETGGKAPQRTWTVMSDGSGLRPLYPEAEYEWVTHEAVITRDEVAIAIMGHRPIDTDKTRRDIQNTDPLDPGHEAGWGIAGTREKPTGLGIVNLRTREMIIAGQTNSGSGLWHVHGSADGRWAVGDDFSRGIYLIDRNNREMMLLSTGHKRTAYDHPHPTFSPDGNRIHIQSAMLSEDGRSMNICIIPVPEEWLNRTYHQDF